MKTGNLDNGNQENWDPGHLVTRKTGNQKNLYPGKLV